MALYSQGRSAEAIAALTTSIERESSARAEFYLDRARDARIRADRSDREPPVISPAF